MRKTDGLNDSGIRGKTSHPSRTFLLLTILTYTLLVFLGIFYHEPWRDEAQAWLLGRDLSFRELIAEMGYDGSPPLWHLSLSLLSGSGLPYFSMSLWNGLLMVTAAFLFLRFGPFDLLTKILFIFSYYMIYEYAVIARSYGMSVLLLFSLAALYQRRLQIPAVFGLLEALLANTNTHSMFPAGAMGLILAYDIYKTGGFKALLSRRFLPALLILSAGVLFAVYSVIPPSDSWKPGLINEFAYLAPADAIAQAFIPACGENPAITLFTRHWTELIFFAVFFLLFMIYLGRSGRALFFFLTAFAGMVYILIFKHSGYLRHYGLILIWLMTALWILNIEKQQPLLPLHKIPGPFRLTIMVFLAVSLFVSTLPGIYYLNKDIRKKFSGSKEMALLLKNEMSPGIPVIAYNVHTMTSLLPYLPGARFWDPGIRDYYTFIHWDSTYLPGRRLPPEEVIHRAFNKAGGHSFLLLLPWPLENPGQYRLQTLQQVFGETITSDEIYFLYRY